MLDARYRRIPLFDRTGSVIAEALVDAADFEALSLKRWRRNGCGYAVQGGRPAGVLMHRQLLGLVPGDGLECDHINRDRLDNRRANLRVMTHAANTTNTGSRRGSTSRFRAVSWATNRGWRARPGLAGRYHHLGYFQSEIDAAFAVDRFVQEFMPFSERDPEFLRLL